LDIFPSAERACHTQTYQAVSDIILVMQEIIEALKKAASDLFNLDIAPELTRPDEQFGDYATNAALQIAGKLNKNPREIAVALASKLHGQDGISEVNIAGPGFINIKLSDQLLLSLIEKKPAKNYGGKTIVVEYSDPNPFKILHAGHLYTSIVGDSIANLLQVAGAKVHRVNFGGDVGLHVGKTMWAILQQLGGENPNKLNDVQTEKRSEWMAQAYIEGTKAYEENETAKAQINELNKRVYQLHESGDKDSEFAQIYWTCREWSYDYFNELYKRIGTEFEKYYPESETSGIGLMTVREHIGDVFEESQGATVFKGERYGLHTRVFINSEGLPTYEAKDVGLIMKKWEDYHFDKSVVITGNEQQQYMSVVLKAVEQFAPELTLTTYHITHGLVKLKGGVKMSSRRGNILRAVDILDVAAEANKKISGNDDERVVLGAVKYAFLKNRIGADIIYDPEESVSVMGNSGPYLQYAHARGRSILQKAQPSNTDGQTFELDDNERSLARKLSEYAEAVEKSTNELMPHYVATYIYELSQTFNRFYEKSRVVGDERQTIRLKLVELYTDILKDSLSILGISAPEKM
jgi:arginyl-tRNA synthetase